MKKKLVSILLCLCMALTLLPTTAMAATTKVYIGTSGSNGKSMGDGSTPKYYVNGSNGVLGTVLTTQPADDNWNAKLETKDGKLTLTLKEFYYNNGVTGITVDTDDDLYIVLEGTNNRIITTNTDSRGIKTVGSLTISGTSADASSLTISARGKHGIYARCTSDSYWGSKKTITIENATVSATGIEEAGIATDESVTITNSIVTASGKNCGISTETDGSISISNSIVTAIATGSDSTAVAFNTAPTVTGNYQWRASNSGDFTANTSSTPTFSEQYLELKPASAGSTTEKTEQTAPAGLSATAPTTAGGNDGKINGTTTAMEYSTDKNSWTACTGTEISGLSAGTYYVRLKETDTHKASDPATVTVPAGSAVTTGTMTFGYAYDVQRSEDTQETNKSVKLHSFQKPYTTSGTYSQAESAGNWTLTYVGTFENYTGKTSGDTDTRLRSVAADVKGIYNLDDTKDVPIYELKLDDTHVTYGVVQARGKVYNNGNLSGTVTDDCGVLFLGVTLTYGSTGYFLTNEGSPINSNSSRYMVVSVDASGSTTPTPTPTPTTVTITYADGTPVTTPKVGDTLKANVTGAPDNATVTYQWCYVGIDNEEIEGATRATYTVEQAYVGKQITVIVRINGKPDSATTGVVVAGSSTPSTSGGSSSGSSSSGNTVTIPVSSDSASVNVKAEVSKGNATVNVSDKQIEQVANDGAGDVTIDVSGLKNVDSATVPSRVVEKTNEAEKVGLTVALPSGSVTLDETALESVTDNANGKDVTVSVVSVPTADLSPVVKDLIGMEPTVAAIVDVNITVNGAKQSSFDGGKVTISIPYTPKKGEDTSKLTVWFIKDDGTIENKGGRYDAKNKCFVFETDHLSQYLLVNTNELVTFNDVPTSAYFYNAVNWAAAQGITGGVDDTHFAPNNACTRAQIVTFLYRWAVANGVDVSVGEDTNILSYHDAFSIPEYAVSAFQWAVGAGIVQGNNGYLNPNQTCTRAQAVAFLYRFAQSTGMDAVTLQELVSGFGDAASVPGYAISAFNWALANGIVQGNDGNLMPNSTCTRAQIVTFLYRFLGK